MDLPDGRSVKLPPLTTEGISRTGEIRINPQHIYTQRIVLNQWIEPASVGKYVLTARLANSAGTEDGKIIPADSAKLTFDVKAKNPEHIKEVSASLSNRVIESKNYEEAAEAALALTNVDDPTAGSYLQRALLSNKMVAPLIINRLRERGGKLSGDVLLVVFHENPSSEITIQTRSALQWISMNTSDTTLKSTIKEALESEP